jgi:hypothetical protein
VAVKLLTAVLIVPAAIVLAIAAFETRIFYPAPSNAPTRGIVWHDDTFATREDFVRWLRLRGVRYGAWARRHPVWTRRHPWLVGVKAGRTAHLPAQQAAKASRASPQGSDWSVNLSGAVAVLAGLGLIVLVADAASSGGIWRRRFPRPPSPS